MSPYGVLLLGNGGTNPNFSLIYKAYIHIGTDIMEAIRTDIRTGTRADANAGPAGTTHIARSSRGAL